MSLGQRMDDGVTPAGAGRTSRLHDQVVDTVGRRIVTDQLLPGAMIVPGGGAR